ncbi:MAG: transcriptional regulator [marine bacterium B5-7]|nr:MAG: transcriptional regulator [marine bacterium B5-7]
MQAFVTPKQLKAARALLGWDQEQLAISAGVSKPTIARLENSATGTRGNLNTIRSIIEALTKNGIRLLGPNEEGVGVLLKDVE